MPLVIAQISVVAVETHFGFLHPHFDSTYSTKSYKTHTKYYTDYYTIHTFFGKSFASSSRSSQEGIVVVLGITWI